MSWIDNGLALVEGMALIASPCILPILPLVLSASLDGGKRRPLGIIVGFIMAFSVFAFFSRWIVLGFGINLDYIKYASLLLLTLLGLVMLSSRLTEKFSALTQGLANVGTTLPPHQQGGFFTGLGIGVLIGLIWTPCAGPILAAVLVQVIRQQDNIQGLITMGFFALGAGIPMLIIALTGRELINRMTFFKQHAQGLRKSLGVLILLSVVFIASGKDPQTLFSSQPSTDRAFMIDHNAGLIDGLSQPYPAPNFAGIKAWLNSSPLDMTKLKGKVVLVDFWTYSCINCVRTLPFITGLDQQFRDKGLVVVGVHAPEFEFEKNIDNIKAAIATHHIQYPVAVDSDLDTWSAYHNRYWPAQYLIDKEGRVVYTHFGEGDDEIIEHNIKVLLGIKDVGVLPAPASPSFHYDQTHETYLGLNRAEVFPAWTLSGSWTKDGEKIISDGPGASLKMPFKAQKVFLVMGTATGKPIQVHILLNGKPVKDLTVDRHTLYDIIDQSTFMDGTLEIKTDDAGLALYAFTFG